MPMPQCTTPLSMRWRSATALIAVNRSSPSSSLASTSPSSSSLFMLLPLHGFRADLEATVDLRRELLGVGEHGVDALRGARGGELEETIEVGVVGQRELRVDAARADEVEGDGPPAGISQLPMVLPDPRDALRQGVPDPTAREDVDARVLALVGVQLGEAAVAQAHAMGAADVREVRDPVRDHHLGLEAVEEGDQLLPLPELVAPYRHRPVL